MTISTSIYLFHLLACSKLVAGVDSCGRQVTCPVVEYLPSACPHVHTKCPVQCPHVQCRAGEEDELQCSHVSGVSPGSAVQ